MFTKKIILQLINTNKIVLTKQILKEYFPHHKQSENFQFKDDSL
tara:strand:- start:74 stop:205 length:132 start_codon:yes stop_codon:yes gene_type:complete